MGANQTVANFAAGFTADYAIALAPNVSFGGLWQLQNNAAHLYKSSVNLSPAGNAGAASFTFSTSRSSIGLTTLETMKFVGTYISTTGFRSNETFGAITPTASNPGFSDPLTFTNFNTFTAVPEPSSMALLAIVGIGSGAWVRFRRSKKAADVPEIANEETVA